MHTVLPPTLFDVTVQLHATPSAIAAAFHLPVALVHAHWLTSTTPIQLPPTSHSPPPTPPPLPPSTRQAYADLAAALATKLAAHLAATQQQHPHLPTTTNPSRPSRARIQQILDNSSLPAPRHNPHALPLPHLPTATHPALPRPHCGFSALATHPDLALDHHRFHVVKPAGGLYRVARSAAPLPPHLATYAELTLVNTAGHGGLAVGVAPLSHQLNRLPGTDPCSAALHASGALVTPSGAWTPACHALRDGDVVGLAVCRKQPEAVVSVFVNGRFVARRSVRDDGAPMHVVACLYRPGARVRLACCPGDWRFFADAAKHVKTLRPTCLAEEDIEAEMSSTSVASGSEGSSGYRTSKNRQSPDRRVVVPQTKGECTSCGSVLTPGDGLCC